MRIDGFSTIDCSTSLAVPGIGGAGGAPPYRRRNGLCLIDESKGEAVGAGERRSGDAVLNSYERKRFLAVANVDKTTTARGELLPRHALHPV
jgi:hypothetical protein